MPHPVVHAEIRSTDPDATRAFFGELFGWTYSDGAFPGYTFVGIGVDGGFPAAIGPRQGGEDTAPTSKHPSGSPRVRFLAQSAV